MFIRYIWGLGLGSLMTVAIMFLSESAFCKEYNLNSLIIAIIVGMILGNVFPRFIANNFSQSLAFCTKKVLRLAIILYGFRISFAQIYSVGLSGLLADVIMLSSTFFIGYYVGTRFFKLDRDLSILTSIGSSICGAAAVLGTDALLKAKPHKVSLAVATVVLFGTISMFLYPFIYKLGILTDTEFGIYIGATVHEVAQVIGAAGSINNDILSTAVIVKLTRVMLLVVFLLILSVYLSKGESTENQNAKITLPYFAFLFVAMCGLNSLDIISPAVIDVIVDFDIFLLTLAMFALGLDTNFKKIKDLGLKPILLAFILFIYLVFAGLIVAKLLGTF
ncbi:MAG: YeiH family protein [Opitutales bacterium]